MKTKYIIHPAQQGTSRCEIRKAKRLYREAKRAKEVNHETILEIVFSDMNYVVIAVYYNLDGIEVLKKTIARY